MPATHGLANLGIQIPPRTPFPPAPQLTLGNGTRMTMPHTNPTAAIEMGVQFGFQMATLANQCQQQADRLAAFELQAQQSEPTCDYDTDTLKQEGLLK